MLSNRDICSLSPTIFEIITQNGAKFKNCPAMHKIPTVRGLRRLEIIMLLNTLKVLKRLYGLCVCGLADIKSVYAEATYFVHIQPTIRSYNVVRGQSVVCLLHKEAN